LLAAALAMNAQIVVAPIAKRWAVQILVNLIGRRIATSIRLFDKTPPGIVCPHFYILSWARGCPYSCSYCYLALTHRFHGNTPHYYSWSRIDKAIDKFFAAHKEPALLNSGELADSLMNLKLMEKICDKFETQDKHKLLLLTKGCRFPPERSLRVAEGSRIRFLVEKRYKQTIFSVSLNAHEFAEVYEKNAPNIYDRLWAAYTLGNFGYEVRIRIDPIIPIRPPNVHGYSWKTAYRDHVKFILKIMHVSPARITLGTPRWFPALPYWLKRAGRKDNFFDNFSKTKEMCVDGRYRLRFKDRVEAYLYLIRTLRKYHYKGPIALCKETFDAYDELLWTYLWKQHDMSPEPEEIRCNCTL
jgi:spore photoproduct lyase